MIVKGYLQTESLLKTIEGYYRVVCPTSMLFYKDAYFILQKKDNYYIIKDIVPVDD